MKKLLSVALCLAIVLSALSFGAAAASNKTQALFDTLKNANEVSVTLKAGDVNLFGFLKTSATDTVYIKGNKLAYEYSLGLVSARAVYDGANVYGFIPQLPLFYVGLNGSAIGQPDVWSLVESVSNITLSVLNYKSAYNEVYNGVEYYVEEFDDRAQVTSKFYYLGDTLKILNVYDAQSGSTNVTYFENISFTVSDSVFNVPTSGLDLTVIFKGLLESMLKQ